MVDYSNVNCTDHENDVTDIIGDGKLENRRHIK